MKRLAFICVFGCLLFLPFLAGAQNSTTVAAIESITIRADEGSGETVVIKLNGSHNPNIFRLDDEPPRLVLDFFDVRYLYKQASIAGKGGKFVQGVRVGRHQNPQKTRVVVDIVPGSSYEYDQTFNVSTNSLEITFYPGVPENGSGPGKQHLQAGKAKIIHGTAAVPEKREDSPEKPAVEKQDAPRVSATQSEASQSVASISSDLKKQKKPESDAAQGSQPPVDQLPPKAEEPLPPPEKTGAPAVETDKTETAASDEAAPAAEEREVQPEKPMGEKQDAQQASATRPETSQSPAGLSSDEAKQKKPESEAAQESQAQVEEPPQKAEEPLPPPDKTGAPAAATDKTETAAADEAPPVLLDVSFEQSINNSETVLFKLSHFYPPLVFGIEKGEPRVVCDFHDAKLGADVPSQIEAGGKYVNRITVASLKDPDKVRVELELVPNHHYDLQQLFFKEDNLFVVIVNELAANGEKK